MIFKIQCMHLRSACISGCQSCQNPRRRSSNQHCFILVFIWNTDTSLLHSKLSISVKILYACKDLSHSFISPQKFIVLYAYKYKPPGWYAIILPKNMDFLNHYEPPYWKYESRYHKKSLWWYKCILRVQNIIFYVLHDILLPINERYSTFDFTKSSDSDHQKQSHWRLWPLEAQAPHMIWNFKV